LAAVDVTVSVDPANSIAAFESEKITALSNLFWCTCKFSRRGAVHMASDRQNNPHPSNREYWIHALELPGTLKG